MERALLVTVRLKTEKGEWQIEDAALEFEELVAACGVEAVDNMTSLCDEPTPNYLIGRGKIEELALVIAEERINVLIFNHDLSGTQQRNIESLVGVKVIDRTQLILDIFARHARSPEGKMQVELAQLQYLMPRLTGKGIILSRLGGGIGTRGPGEQKLEVDRRTIRKRIDRLKDELKSVFKQRQVMRKRRKNNLVPLVSLVGYTSAGKSTLLNALTGSDQVVSSGLFTTLDPLTKAMQLENGENIVLSDTVGFLHNLPHHLIEAFKATLEELLEADLIIHVLDVSSNRVFQHDKAVQQVLKELGAENKPTVVALNKIDLIEDKMWLEKVQRDFNSGIPISAKLKINLGLLLRKIEEEFGSRMIIIDTLLPINRMDLVNLFYKEGRVDEVKYLQKGIRVKARIPKVLFNKLSHSNEIGNIS